MNIDSELGGDHLIKTIEVKNEDFGQLAKKEFELIKNRFSNLQILNLSMNKITNIEGGIDCPNLRELALSDNLIKQIHPFLLSNLPKL